ncbi:MAG: DUF2914 domain-containing protein, partial [Pseudomonadota bacterium]
TELRGMSDKSVSHIWKHEGEVVSRVEFDVGGPRWRVWSSKALSPMWEGDWTLLVEDSWGNVYAEESFSYSSAVEAGK